MILLSDTDIIIKLCACDLMDAALDCLDAKPSDVRILHEARAIVKYKSEKLSFQYGKRAFKKIQDFVAKSKMAKTGPLEERNTLVNIPGVDPGERFLLAATSQYENFRLVTADRTCLEAFGEHKGARKIKKRIKGCCYCYEQVLLKILEHYKFNYILHRSTQLFKTDYSFKKKFSGGKPFRKNVFVSILNSRIKKTKKIAGDIMGDFTS